MAPTGLSWSVLILVVLVSKCFTSGREKACSCYTFENRDGINRLFWERARNWCESYNKSLVAMETIEEWELINSSLKDQKGNQNDEWHIGLLRNPDTNKWSWINGKPLTFDKWQPGKPKPGELYVYIAREFPSGYFGSFNSINRDPMRGWICEEQTDKCQGICMHHYSASTTFTARPPTTDTIQSSSTSSTTPVSTKEIKLTDSTTSSTVSNIRSTTVYQEGETKPITATIIAAALGAALFVLLLLLVVVVVWKRKKRLGKDPENLPASLPKQPEHQYESVPSLEATKLLGQPQNGKESPQVECEYAVVNKQRKKERKGELVYAELADFGDANDDKEKRKPEHCETTVYADVVTSDLYHKANADASDPAYANVQSVK